MDYDHTPFTGIINNFMLILEIEQPKTPEQQRLAQLQASSKRASNAVKLERNRQKMQKALLLRLRLARCKQCCERRH